MDLFNAIADCFTGSSSFHDSAYYTISEVPANDHELVASLLQSLFTTDKTGPALKAHVESIVHPDSWTSHLAQLLLDGLVHALNSSAQMGGAMKEAFDRASAATELFVREHPVLVGVVATVVAIGILALLVPWAIEALGFAELGPIEGSWAALWQSTFPDVTADSWFAFFQRLGMNLGKK